MGHFHNIVVHHNTRRTFDRVHDPKDLIDTVLIKRIFNVWQQCGSESADADFMDWNPPYRKKWKNDLRELHMRFFDTNVLAQIVEYVL